MLDEVKAFVVVQRNCGRWLHVHCSTPCSSGSPLKHLNQKRDQTEADRDWHSIIGSAEAYLTLGDSRSFELPKHNQIWQRPETQRILERCGLNYDAEVALCQTGLVNDEGTPIGKRLKFFATSPYSLLCEFAHKEVWNLCMSISCGIQHRQLASHRLLQQDVGKGHSGCGKVFPKGTLLIEPYACLCSNSCGHSIKRCGFTFFGMC